MAENELGKIIIETHAAERQVERAYERAGERAGQVSGARFVDGIRDNIVGMARRFGGSGGGLLASAALDRSGVTSQVPKPGAAGYTSPVVTAAAARAGATAGARGAASGAGAAAAAGGGGLTAGGGIVTHGALMGAAASAGPAIAVVGIIVAAGVAIKKTIDTLNQWDRELEQSARQYARVNATFARTMAAREIFDLQRNMVKAQALEGVFTAREAMRQRRLNAQVPTEIMRQQVGGIFGATRDALIADVLEDINSILLPMMESVNSASEHTQEIARTVSTIITVGNPILLFLDVLGKIADMLPGMDGKIKSIDRTLTTKSLQESAIEQNRMMAQELFALANMGSHTPISVPGLTPPLGSGGTP